MRVELTRDQRERLKTVEHSNRARARKAGAVVEPVDFVAICEGQEWRCAETGAALDPSLPWPKDASISLDHIIGLSVGGSHTADNIRAVLWSVNRQKGNEVETPQSAKIKRLRGETGQQARRKRRKEAGTYVGIPSRANAWPAKGSRKLNSRGFR